MNDAIETVHDDASGLTARVMYDSDSESPRGWSNVARLVQLGKDYNQCDGPDDGHGGIVRAWARDYDTTTVERYARAWLGAVAVDWTESDNRSSSGWRVFGYVTADDARAELVADGEDVSADELATRARACLAGELDTYRQWADGEVYGYVIEDASGAPVNDGSLWGLFGLDYATESAREALDSAGREVLARWAAAGKPNDDDDATTYARKLAEYVRADSESRAAALLDDSADPDDVSTSDDDSAYDARELLAHVSRKLSALAAELDDMRAQRDATAGRGPVVVTWADARGVWFADVTAHALRVDDARPLASEAIASEIAQRAPADAPRYVPALVCTVATDDGRGRTWRFREVNDEDDDSADS